MGQRFPLPARAAGVDDGRRGMEYALLETVREILVGPSIGANAPALDELTGAYATRYGVLRLHEEAERALRYRHSLSCFILDIDGLETINLAHGKSRGDPVLQDIR